MKTNELNRKHLWPPILAFFFLLAFLLTACSTSLTTSQPPGATPQSALQLPSGSHAPVILRTTAEQQQVINGWLITSWDIYFTDPDGDAVAVTYEVTSSSLSYPLHLPETPIETSAEEQQAEALYTEMASCWQKMELTYTVRIRDQTGNLSEAVPFSISCPAPQPLDTKPLFLAGISQLIPLGLLLVLGFWLLFRKRPGQRPAVLRSTVLMFLLFMLVAFSWGILHEGGHSLYLLANGIPVTLYIHPFSFSAFSRPIVPGMGIWKDILGSAAAFPVSLLISAPFWKRRSLALLPLVLLFPFSALGDGFNVMGFFGDFWNLVQLTGLPASLFWILGALMMCVGIISFLSLLPLAGLDPRDNKALFVLPAAMWLISTLSLLVAHGFVPGSPINLEFFAGQEILRSVNGFFFLYFGIGLAILYVTLFRRLYPHLPAWLRNETVAPAWKDLRLPGILWAVSVVIGLIIVI